MSELDWDGPNDTQNPHSWSRSKKIYHVSIPTIIAFLTPYASSIIVPSSLQLQQQFHLSEVVSLLPFSLFILGVSLGPLIAAPLSETVGRRSVYLTSLPLLGLFSLGAGFCNDLAALLVCRFFAGLAASPGLALGPATVADIFTSQERAIPVSIMIFTPFIAPPLSIVSGSFIVVSLSWRWTQWIIAISTAVVMLFVSGMQETYKPTILSRRRKALGHAADARRNATHESRRLGNSISSASALQVKTATQQFFHSTLRRPLYMLFTEPLCGFIALYTAFVFAMLYAFQPGIPYTFATYYAFSHAHSSLPYLALVIGVMIAEICYVVYTKYLQRQQRQTPRHAAQSCPPQRGTASSTNDLVSSDPESSSQSTTSLTPQPESALLPTLLGSPCLTVALFWFGWSAGRTPWIVPSVAIALYGFGIFLVWTSSNLYLINAYGPLYGASAVSGTRMLSFAMGIFFPLFMRPMLQRLGVAWTMSLFGFVSLALAPASWYAFFWGARLRSRKNWIDVE